VYANGAIDDRVVFHWKRDHAFRASKDRNSRRGSGSRRNARRITLFVILDSGSAVASRHRDRGAGVARWQISWG
jgi:hypothetical protein